MCDEYAGKPGPVPDCQQLVLKTHAGKRIELAERFVEKQHLWRVDERPCQRCALGHASRQLMRIGLGKSSQPNEVQGRVDLAFTALQFVSGGKTGGDVVPNIRPGKQGGILKCEDA